MPFSPQRYESFFAFCVLHKENFSGEALYNIIIIIMNDRLINQYSLIIKGMAPSSFIAIAKCKMQRVREEMGKKLILSPRA